MKKLLLLLTVLAVIPLSAQRVECIGDEQAGMGLAGTFPCRNYDLLSNIPLAQFDAIYNNTGVGPAFVASTGSDSWGWTDPDSGREIAIISYTEGFAYVEITDPINPVILAIVPVTATDLQRLWRDVKVYKNHAYMVGEDTAQGLKILELTQLLDITDPPRVMEPDAFFQGFGSAHNIAVNEETGYLYPIGTRTFDTNTAFMSGGPLFINIQDPLNPVFEGGYDSTNDGANAYSHDAQIVIYDGPDQDYQGQEIYMGANEETLLIADITDKANPKYISDLGYTSSQYTHQGWFTKDKRFFVMGDELDETMNAANTRMIIYNVEDLDNPSIAFFWEGPTMATDHNIYIIEDTLYLANYVEGLRTYDISQIADDTLTPNQRIAEIGFFDTLPGGNVGLGAVWNAYPYFPSGNIILSDLEGGLFVVGPSNELLGTNDSAAVAEFKIFPNPAKNQVNLTFGDTPIQSILITNVIGKQVYAAEGLTASSKVLDTSNFATGVYLISVNGKNSQKLIIE